jgi:hypothetical protein
MKRHCYFTCAERGEFLRISVVHKGQPPNEWEGWGGESHILHVHNFASLPTKRGKVVKSSSFSCFGSEWSVWIYPGGDTDSKDGYMSISLQLCSNTEISVQYNLSIKNNSGGTVASFQDSHKFTQKYEGHCWSNFASCAAITDGNVLKHGLLTVEVCFKPEPGLHFIPKNPFVQNMVQLFSDEETANISFKVGNQSISSSSALSKVFSTHKLVLKTCAKGSILASLCDRHDGSDQ